MIDVKIDIEPLKELNEKLARKVVPQSAARAANRAVGAARVSARRQLQESLHEQRDLFKGFTIKRAKASGAKPTASLEVKGKGLPLSALKHEIVEIETRRGLRLGVRVFYRGQSYIVPKAFVAQLREGSKSSIYRRKGRARFPIERMYARHIIGGSEADLLAEPSIRKRMIKSATAVFQVGFNESFGELTRV